ncbi:MAG: ribonuclease HIII [Bacilli bacterium]|nr:ribonuclease HIII [Bacilli bacterium]
MKPLVTITVNQEKLEEMKAHYASFLIDNDSEYVYFFVKKDDLEITGFSGKKEKKKVVFKGDDALKEARIWDESAKENEAKEKVKEAWMFFENQIGSDEVGVGDFLLPMIVVAAYVDGKQISLLKKYGVHDSKKLTDAKIKEIGPSLAKEFHFSKLTLHNDKYNEMLLKGENLNSLKAKMHNRALLNMHKEFPEVNNIFIDEFVAPKTYYKYLNDANEEQVKDIISKTKGESYFPCVALASVIARYSFLLEKEKLEAKYGMEFPFGASSKANEFAMAFIEKYGIKEFDKIAKKNFANYREVISNKLF